MRHVIAIDQGTTGIHRARPRRAARSSRGRGYQEFRQIYPQPGWVEHDPEDIWASVIERARPGARRASTPASIAAIGITNQRETTVAVGSQDRQARCTTRSSGRTGAPPIAAPSSRPRGNEARVARAHRAHARSVLLGHQDQLDAAATSPGIAARRARRRARVRHDRLVPAVAAHRRRGPRDRRHQRVAHAAVRPPHARVVRRAARADRRAARAAARGRRVVGARRHDAAACPACPTASRSRASPAISSRRCSARRASRPATRSARTAPARSS